ncbi:hypothetical protein [Streptomyces goshikiensis]|uniref:hypothetical protein n=1 Tax=Streptomyces goshikiensis TaxID=1942 RepID=UPI003660A3E0
MAAALSALADVPPPTDREAVREEYLRRVIPEFTGHQVDDVTWTTAHGDLHYGNVTRGPHILDWEGWGRVPYGYDAATLYVYALLTPETAARVRTELSPSWSCPRPAPECSPCAPRSFRPRTASTSTPNWPLPCASTWPTCSPARPRLRGADASPAARQRRRARVERSEPGPRTGAIA